MTSPSIEAGASVPRENTPDGRNVSPALSWQGLPAETREIAVVCADFGAGNPPPWVHWIVYGIPGSAEGLPADLPVTAEEPMPPGLEGARQGRNGWGLALYRGPAPPPGRAHVYHFTVYALDAELGLAPGLDRDELLAAMAGHVLARGDLTAVYERF